MNNNEEQDLRGYDLKADNFKNQLLQLINNSNLNISTIYYIVKDVCRDLQDLFNQMASQQYKEFCEEVNKQQENNNDDAIVEEENKEE